MTDPSTGSGQGGASADRRFIEESFPVKEVSAISAREKNIRHGHISTLHIWWARRPLAASRATAYAALTPTPPSYPSTESLAWQRQRDFIVELSQWENSLNLRLLEKARRDILEAHAARMTEERVRAGLAPAEAQVTVEDIEAGRVPRPRVLDPFAGGGAIPLEALRLGCETTASDCNPVAVLILKATLEYPQKYGTKGRGETQPRTMPQPTLFDLSETDNPQSEIGNPLLQAVKKWGDWVLEEARKELAEFYLTPSPQPPSPLLPGEGKGEAAPAAGGKGEVPVGYIWARTIPCQNPACGAEIPLMRQFWLAKKPKKKVALYPCPSPACGGGNGREVTFRIVGDGPALSGAEGYESWPAGFDPAEGSVARAVATCPVCGGTIDADTTRRLFQESQAGQRMVAVVLIRAEGEGKTYRVATAADEAIYRQAEAALQAKRERLMAEWGMSPVPDEPLPPVGTLGFRIQRYGMTTWGDLFNTRQQLALITFGEKVRQAHEQMVAEVMEPEFAKVVTTYLGLAVDMAAAFANVLARWENTSEAIKQLYSRHALPMLWDYAEVNPFSGSSGSFESGQEYYLKVIEHCCTPGKGSAVVTQASATQLPDPDATFDAILTDPPYYDNVPYSYLSDFFYVWLKRSVGYLYPELFSTPLTPKTNEVVAYSHGEGGWENGKRSFEDNLKRAFQEMHRTLKPKGIAVIVYAHKSTEGWETVINALLDSGLVVTGAWPLNTEMRSRLRSMKSATLASAIYIVARKPALSGVEGMVRRPTGFYNDVRAELRAHLEAKLHRLWEEGIGGADFFIAAIGSAIEVFGKYERVMDWEGAVVRADWLLEEVRTIATDYAVRLILGGGGFETRPCGSEVSGLTRLYVLWRWDYGEARVPFDEARKLAQSCGVDLAREWERSGGFICKEEESVRVLGPHQRKWDETAGQRMNEETPTHSIADSPELIDVLHRVLLLWERGRREEMVQALAATGYGRSEAFYRVAQAISETLALDSREKKLLDGFLVGRERVREEAEKVEQQGRLWEE